MVAVSVKSQLETLLNTGDLDAIETLAADNPGILGRLFPFTYRPDPIISWRAIEAMGRAAKALAGPRPETVVTQLRNLYWLLSEESGGAGWRAPEAIAEIIFRAPGIGIDYVPILGALLDSMAEEDLGKFRSGILWGIGRIHGLIRRASPEALPAAARCLEDRDPQVRGMAAWALGQLGTRLFDEQLKAVCADAAPVQLYREGKLVATTVGELAREALG